LWNDASDTPVETLKNQKNKQKILVKLQIPFQAAEKAY